jgi:hypothetical protein
MTLDLFEVPLDSRYSKLHHYPLRCSAAIPAGWEIVLDLTRRLAHIRKEERNY